MMALTSRPVTSLRHPREHPVLLLSLLPLMAWLLVAGSATVGWLFLLLASGWFLLWVQARLHQTRLLATGVRVSATQLPHLLEMLLRCEATLPLAGAVDLMVIQSPVLHAYTFACHTTRVIVVTSALVAALTPDELQAVIAHEWGHLALRHPLRGSVFGVLTRVGMVQSQWARLTYSRAGPTPPRRHVSYAATLLNLVATLLVPLLFLAYRRYTELSADRVAVAITGTPDGLCGALAKIMVGPELATQLSESALIEQAEGVGRSWFGRWHLAEAGHPFIGTRLRAARGAAAVKARHLEHQT